jgi:hypothetical protein
MGLAQGHYPIEAVVFHNSAETVRAVDCDAVL